MRSALRYLLCACCTLLFLLPAANTAHAQWRKKKKKGSTEQQLLYRLIGCMQRKDAYCYMDLFPDMDTLSKLIMRYSDSSSRDFREMAALQEDPVRIMHADSVFRAQLKGSFDTLISQGEEADIHWGNIVLVRYELQKMRQTRNTLYEQIAPNRFVGYVFFLDAVTRKVHAFAVTELLQIGGEWYGGYLRSRIYEAGTRDEYLEQRAADLRRRRLQQDAPPVADTAKKQIGDTTVEEERRDPQKTVVERKFYSGMFDNEIPVQLYIRGLKGGCPDGICSWEAIYKFGDQDDYVLLVVSRTAEGKWEFIEDPPTGSMELTLDKGVFTGTWISADNQTGYDVKFTEVPASNKRIDRLDAAFAELKNARGRK